MSHGFVKVAAATPEIKVADCAYNTEAVLSLWREAEERGCQLVAFPELVLTGSTCGDLFHHQTLIEGSLQGLKKLIDSSYNMQSVAIVGAPLLHQGKLLNCAVVIQKGNVLGIVPKINLSVAEQRFFDTLPSLDIEEYRTLSELGGINTNIGSRQLFIHNQKQSFTFSIEFGDDLLAPVPPSTEHALAGASIIVDLSANHEIIGSAEYRRKLIESHSSRMVCGYIYANAGTGESTTDLVFACHNIIAEYGDILTESKPFDTGLIITDIDVDKLQQERRKKNFFSFSSEKDYQKTEFNQSEAQKPLDRTIDPMPFIPTDKKALAERCELILSIQAQGLKKRFVHSWSKTAVIGISGGLDSTLALLVAARTMDLLNRPRTDIVAVTMPCFGTTSRTRSNAELLCQELGVAFRTVDIGNTVKAHFADIGHDFNDHSVTFENGQARERTQVLMDIANQVNGMVVGTGDLSELALGWATYNGDHMSMYGVNGGIPKTLVRHIVRHAAETTDNSKLSETLLDILDTPVSPELLPAKDGEIAQKTEDLVGPYELHDFFLYNAVRWSFPPKKIYELAQLAFAGQYDNATILHWLRTFFRRFFNQQFKRSCLPDGPKVGTVGLSPRGDWNMPSDAMSTLWLEEIDNLKA